LGRGTLARGLLIEHIEYKEDHVDFTTLVGIIACFGLIILAVLTREGATIFVNMPSMMIVMGGTLGAVLVTYPADVLFSIFGIVRKAFLSKSPDNAKIIMLFEKLARKARREGLLSLQSAENDLEDEFFKKGLLLVVDGREADTVEAILTAEVGATAERHQLGAEVFEKLGLYAPAFGMLGTVIGLIQMLQTMDDPSSIGPAMAVALVTTFYGALFANVVFIPVSGKLRVRSREEVFRKEMLTQGFLSLLAGDDPHVMSEKLRSMVAPATRRESQKGE